MNAQGYSLLACAVVAIELQLKKKKGVPSSPHLLSSMMLGCGALSGLLFVFQVLILFSYST
jgi:hypothetical protein